MCAEEDIWFLDCVPAKYPGNAANYAYSDQDNDDEEAYQPPKEPCGMPRRREESLDDDSSSGEYRLPWVCSDCTLIDVSIVSYLEFFTGEPVSPSDLELDSERRRELKRKLRKKKKRSRRSRGDDDDEEEANVRLKLRDLKALLKNAQKLQKITDFLCSEVR